jgi:hypothetical protein
MKLNRRLAAGAVATVAVLSLASTATPAFASSHRSEGKSRHHHHENSGGTTTVVLNQAIVPALVGLGVAPVAPGTLTAPGNVYQVAFPITEIEHSTIGHRGGLEFTMAAAGDVKITKFVIDLNTGLLTAQARVNGAKIGRIPVFKLGAVQEISTGVTPACAGTAAGLTLTPEAAGALGVPAGLFIGDACIVPSGHDED